MLNIGQAGSSRFRPAGHIKTVMDSASANVSSIGPEAKGIGTSRGPEITLNNILVPTDFSAESQLGGSLAGELARQFHAGVHWLHVLEPPALPEWGYVHLALRDNELRKKAEHRLPQLAAECGMDPSMVKSAEIATGEAAHKICEHASRAESDLIVMASHGLGNWPHFFGGSTTLRVVRHAPCPVLTVREGMIKKSAPSQRQPTFKRILVTTDFSEASTKSFAYASALARKFDSTITLLFVVPQGPAAEYVAETSTLENERLLSEARERLPRFRETRLDPRMRVSTLVVHGLPAKEIVRTAELQDMDLIVISTHGRAGSERFFLGSVTENVICHAPCPVLVVREREHEFVKTPALAIKPA